MDRVIGTSCESDRPRVLLADDELHVVEILSLHLQRAGYEVLVADNGINALELAQTLLPCVIVVDEQMPGLRGSEVADRLAENPATASIPTILLTGYGSGHQRSGNIQRIISKPFSVRDVVRAILELGIRRQVAAMV